MLWAAYSRWRFDGVDPYALLMGGRPPGPWATRHEAVLMAFSMRAARMEAAVQDLGAAFGGGE